jgi:hypothetical protein
MAQPMRKKITYILSALIFVAAVYLLGKAFLPYVFDRLGGVDRDYVKKMESIKIGMTEQEVIKILGQPQGIITDPEVKETHGLYGGGKEYGKLVKNSNKVLYYHHGVDYIGHYFIDKQGKVWFINVGGT